MSASTMSVSQEAYRSIVLHCAKHPASATTGLLLGPAGSTNVVRAIPLQHHWNQLSPMVEVGCSLVQAYASSLPSALEVIGVYFAPSDVASSQRSQLHPTAMKVAQMVAGRRGGDAIALQVNNAKLGSKTEHCLTAFKINASSSANANALPGASLELSGGHSAVAAVRADVTAGRWKGLFDFDDHLENTSLDWLSTSA